MKTKIYLLLVLLGFSFSKINAQEKITTNYFEGQQPRSEISVSMKHYKEIGATGQQFGIIIANLTTNKIKVYGRYYAKLVNGSQKSKAFEIEIKPLEKEGGNGIFGDADLSETVFPEDCKAVNNTRIKNVGFQITDVLNLTEMENKKQAIYDVDKKYKEDSQKQYEADQQKIKDNQAKAEATQNEQQRKIKESQDRINEINKIAENQRKSNGEMANNIGNEIIGGLKDIQETRERRAEIKAQGQKELNEIIRQADISIEKHKEKYREQFYQNRKGKDLEKIQQDKTVMNLDIQLYNFIYDKIKNANMINFIEFGKDNKWLVSYEDYDGNKRQANSNNFERFSTTDKDFTKEKDKCIKKNKNCGWSILSENKWAIIIEKGLRKYEFVGKGLSLEEENFIKEKISEAQRNSLPIKEFKLRGQGGVFMKFNDKNYSSIGIPQIQIDYIAQKLREDINGMSFTDNKISFSEDGQSVFVGPF